MGRYPTALTARDRLRTKLLTSGLYDLVPLAEVESVITGEHLAATTAEQQAESAVRSLVADGLMKFEGWDDLSLAEARHVGTTYSSTTTPILQRGHSLSGSNSPKPENASRRNWKRRHPDEAG